MLNLKEQVKNIHTRLEVISELFRTSSYYRAQAVLSKTEPEKSRTLVAQMQQIRIKSANSRIQMRVLVNLKLDELDSNEILKVICTSDVLSNRIKNKNSDKFYAKMLEIQRWLEADVKDTDLYKILNQVSILYKRIALTNKYLFRAHDMAQEQQSKSVEGNRKQRRSVERNDMLMKKKNELERDIATKKSMLFEVEKQKDYIRTKRSIRNKLNREKKADILKKKKIETKIHNINKIIENPTRKSLKTLKRKKEELDTF